MILGTLPPGAGGGISHLDEQEAWGLDKGASPQG